MSVITLTTDFGESDYYAGALKGKILSINQQANITDISHHISTFNINHAAYVIGNAWSYFPEGTIHIIGVLSMPVFENRFLILQKQSHYFISSDNGIFSLLFGDKYDKIYKIKTNDRPSTFPEIEYFAETAGLLSLGEHPSTFTEEALQIKENIPFRATHNGNSIKAAVMHIDNYQNVVLNVNRALFSEIGKGRKFSINYNRNDFIDQLHQHFGEVPPIDKMCFFNHAGWLEIAINQGKASELLGLYQDSVLLIDFND